MHKAITASAAALALTTASFSGLAQTYNYRLSEIGRDRFNAVNRAGFSTGSGIPCRGCDKQAFLLARNRQIFIGSQLLGASQDLVASGGADINDRRQTTGTITFFANATTTSPKLLTRAFIWDGTSLQLLATLDGEGSEVASVGAGINRSGQVTGTSGTASGEARAFLWDGETMRDLGTLGGFGSRGFGINKSGQVTGASNLATDPPKERAFLWDGATMRDIGTLGGNHSTGTSINDTAQITGSALTTDDAAYHAFFWDKGLMTDLGTLGGPGSDGLAINNSGQVVGISDLATGGFSPFLWENGVMKNLHILVAASDPLKPYVRFLEVADINDLGQILVRGFNRRLQGVRSYLLSPRYKLTPLLSPAGNSARRGSIVRIAVGLLDAANTRIPDSRAALLAAAPCRVQVSTTGAQSLIRSCMTYDATRDEFYFDWTLGPTATGTTNIEVRVNYGAPGPLKTTMAEAIEITK
jgi:probable HAF family extracellular repeat protein